MSLTLSPILDDARRITGISTVAHDIRARKAAARALKASEEKYRRLFETASDGILILDGTHLTVIDANERFFSLLERDRSVLLGKRLQEIGLFARPGDTERLTSELVEHGHLRLLELQLLTGTGRPVDTEFLAERYVIEGTEVYQCNIRDVSDRQRAERALRESERRFHSLMDNVQLIALMLDRDGRITYCNDYFLTLAGCKRLDVIGQNWFEFFVPDDQRAEVEKVMSDMMHGSRAAWHHENDILTRSGERRLVRWNNTALRGPDGKLIGTASLGADITDYRRASNALKASEQRLRTLIENMSDAIAIGSPDGTLSFISPSIRTICGFEPETLLGSGNQDMVHPDDIPGVRTALAALAAHPDETQRGDLRLRHKNGGWVNVEYLATNHVATPGIEGLAVTLRDVTWRREAEADLRLANLLIEQSPTVLFRWAAAEGWPVEYVSQNIRQWGYEPDALMAGEPPFIDLIHPDDRQRVGAEVTAHVNGGETSFAQEYRIVAPSGQVFWVDDRTTVERDADGRPVHFQGVVMDITEQKLAELDRQDRLARVERQLDGLSRITRSKALASGNLTAFAQELTELATEVTGAARASVWAFNDFETELRCIDLFERDNKHHSAGRTLQEQGHRKEFAAIKRARYVAADDALADPRTAGHAQTYLKPAGITSMLGALAQIATHNLGLLSIEHVGPARHWESDEISFACQLADQFGLTLMAAQRKRDAANLQHLNRALSTLSAGNAAVVHAQTEDELLGLMCQIVVDSGGYRMAWVGYVRDDPEGSIDPVAWAGEGAERIANTVLSSSDPDSSPQARSIANRQTQTISDMDDDPALASWREAGAQHGARSALALPLYTGDRVLGVMCIYARESHAFAKGEIALLEEMAGDLAYGITTRRTQIAHDEGLLQLARSLDATVESLASTVELRDPYTAGHQRRVAEIAVAIAGAIGLPEDRIKGLKLAAGIHDIGKISIPAEILAKPTRLTHVEYELVKGHAEAGYQLLQGIEFPWPVAQIIRQHHERIDGSGYPQGLNGDQILLEAKILAVSDVVEAIGSHRPYRAGKGIEAALDEIVAGRGTLFDAGIVDACVLLFREQGFALPGQ